MSQISLAKLAGYCDRILHTVEVEDYERAAQLRDQNDITASGDGSARRRGPAAS